MRFTCWALVVFQCLFLNFFVPLHTRGAVTLCGKAESGALSAATQTAVESCCAQPAAGGQDERGKPTPEDRKACAVCYIVSAYVPIDPIFIEHQLRECVRLSHEAAVAQVRSVEYPMPFWPVGPPMAA